MVVLAIPLSRVVMGFVIQVAVIVLQMVHLIAQVITLLYLV